MSKLLPPKRVRRVLPHVCAMCNEFEYGDGSWECLRGAVSGDTGDGRQYETTCDRWRKALRGDEPKAQP